MKNIHTRLVVLIIALLVGAAYVVYTRPTKQGLDIQGGMRVVLQAQTDKLPRGVTWDNTRLDTVTNIMRHRVDSLGVSEPVVYPKPPDQIVVELPGLTNRQQALQMIQDTARLEFRYVPELDPDGTWTTKPETIKSPDGDVETGYETILNKADSKPVSQDELQARVFDKPPILTGADLKPNAMPDVSQGSAIIHFEFQEASKGTFEDFTRTHIQKTLAIFLDNRLISAPQIRDVIPGEGIIEGRFTPEAARTLANQLNAGALPVPLTQVQVTNLEATLGKQAVHQTLIAGLVGLIAVLIFMVAYYRVPGLLADGALLLYALFTFAIYKLIPVTLTVPGIAGFILSIGMAVDANILIFERMKEERNAGKTMRAAIEAGFKRAFTAIFDSNMCTLITCAILYHFGTGSVQGFALTLAIGVAVSMFTAITVSRTFLLLLAGTQFGQNDALYALGPGLHPKLGISRRMGVWFGISLAIIIPGAIFWGLGGLKRSIEFTGGTEVSTQFTRHATASQINAALASIGHREVRTVIAEGNRAEITLRTLKPGEDQTVLAALQDKVAPIASETVTNKQTGQPETRPKFNVSSVGSVISKELTRNAFLAVAVASLLIILYLAIRFSIPNFVEGLKYGTCAVIALLHDVLVVTGAFAVFGYFLNWQIDSLFVTALLTVIGFSVHDTIVIFDRIRENLKHKERGEGFASVADRSIEQTFARSVNTTATVVFTLLALLILGGPVVRTFVAALLVGVVSGAYSSIFNATPLLVLWKRLTGDRDLAMAGAGAGGATVRSTPRRAEPARPRPVTQPAAIPQRTATVPRPAPAAAAPEGDEDASAAQRAKPKKRKRRM